MLADLTSLAPKVSSDDLNFLKGLSEKFPLVEYVLHKHEISKFERNRILDLLGPERNLTLEPAKYVYGCAYLLGNVTDSLKYNLIIGVRENLWPKVGNSASYSEGFNFLSKWFMKDSNLKLLASVGREIPTNRYSDYDY